MIDGIGNVIQRISNIERRFASASIKTDFPAYMSAAEQHNTASISNPATNEILTLLTGAAKQHGVDPRLAIAVARTESGLSPEAKSSAGAIGIMQLMPETAATLGVQNVQDPRQNIDGGVRYLRQLLDKFDGNTEKALAAYNAGPQAVQEYDGVPPYQETVEYVAKVKKLYG
jgi:soluble lytic murein transglycosylase-like protein